MKRHAAVIVGAAAAAALAAAPAGAAHHPRRGACPRTDATAPVSRRAGAADELVPPGARAVVVCGYRGAGVGSGRPNPFRHRRTIARLATVRRLARELNAVQPDPPGTARSCPADRGEGTVVALFRYPHGPASPVTLRLGGCQLVTNGHLHLDALSPSGAAAVRDLRRLAGLAGNPN